MHFAYPFLHFSEGIPVPCTRCREVVRFFVSGCDEIRKVKMKKTLFAIMALSGQLLMADALQDALDNTNLVFTIDGEDYYWDVVGNSQALGGSCVVL